MSDKTARTAARLHAAFQNGAPIADIPEGDAPATQQEAFAIQDAVFALLGHTPGAWKVGGSPGTEPTAAPIAASKLYSSGQVLAPEAHRNFGVEAELAFRLDRDLPARDVPYTAEDLRAAVASLIVTMEIVESRLRDWPKVDPLWALMDFQANDSLVLGTEMPVPDALDIPNQPVRVLFDGKVAFEDTGSFKGGDPFTLMAWLANHVPERTGSETGRGLKAGDVITTGSWNGVSFAGRGVAARIEFPGLGEAEMRFG
ncbi:2-keto-4-pentenoate hydratase [Nisaea sp.]|uniref:2-keto-4-pentenoate hydratase n=1 Tax=Nisaea sp. TaxID=2024842 RepID=UPI003B5285E7